MTGSDRATDAMDGIHDRASNGTEFKTFGSKQVGFWLFWEAAKNSFLNALRYVIIAGLFVYLLTAVVLLSDIMAFHDRVKSDVGDDARARRVVLKLHEMHENPEKYPVGTIDLPVGTLAVSLGSLKSSHDDLKQFEDFERAPTDDDGAGPPPPLVNDDDKKIYVDLMTFMTKRVEDLNGTLDDNEPPVRIKRAIDVFGAAIAAAESEHQASDAPPEVRLASLERHFGTLRRSIVEADTETPAHDLLLKVQARLDRLVRNIAAPDAIEALKVDVETLGGSIDDVIAEIDRMKNATGAPPTVAAAMGSPVNGAPTRGVERAAAVREELQTVRARLAGLSAERIEPIDYAAEMDQLMSDVQDLRNRLTAFAGFEAQRDRLGSALALIEQAKAEPVSEASILGYLEELDGFKEDIDGLAASLPVDPVATRILGQLDEMAGELAAARQVIDGTSPGDATLSTSFERHLASIEDLLRQRYPGRYQIVSELVDNIDGLRGELGLLQRIQPRKYRDPDGDLLQKEEAQSIFEGRLKAIGDELETAEDRLRQQGRVVALANVLEENENETAKSANVKAMGIIHDFDALNRFGWLMMPLPTLGLVSPRSEWAQFGFNPLKLATLTTSSITTIYVLVIGAIGSLIYITKYQLKLVIDGQQLRTRPPRPLPWFLFRPMFGVVVALALYFLIRAGQLALGSGSGDEVGTTLNIPILSVLALFAGILSWQALAMIETRGSLWFKAQSRKPLWATGLSNALRTHRKSTAECAEQIGRSTEQVERWLVFHDKVPVELQDRIATWIDMRIDELFGDVKPSAEAAGKPMWAVGLKHALDSHDRQIDAKGLAELLRDDSGPESVERIRDWIALKLQVSPATQWRLVDLLEVPHHLLFAPELQDREVWGTRLRPVIEKRKERTSSIADRLALDPSRVHAWKELDERIPPAMQERLMGVLERGFTELFEAGELAGDDWHLAANDLAAALANAKMDKGKFAEIIDVEIERVDRWITEKEPIAKPTRERIVRLLGDSSNLFETPRGLPSPGGPAGAGPKPEENAGGPAFAARLKEAMAERGIADAAALAVLVYRGDPPLPQNVERVQRWIDGTGEVPRTRRKSLADALQLSRETLFS